MPPLFAQGLSYALPFVAAYLIWMIPEAAGNLLALRREEAPQRRDDGASGLVILLGIVLLPLAAVAISLSVPSAGFARHLHLIFFVGIAAMLIGVALRWYSVHTLGRYFSRSIAIQKGHEIISFGPYRILRHPSYTGTMLTLLGIGLVTTNWLALLTTLLGGFATYSYRVIREERVLVRELGEPYLNYMKRTKRFIPWVF